MGLDNILLIPGIGQMSFRDALSLLAPYSPRLAYNFIDPANSLFQGNTLTPVTTVTNPVGVVIDQTQGGLSNLGPELLTNGDFSDGETGWTLEAGWTVAGGQASGVGTGTITYIRQDGIYPDTSTPCLITFTVTERTGVGSGTLFGTPTVTGLGAVVSSPKTYSLVSINRTSSNFRFYVNTLGHTLSVDNISVRELPGNHATASSDAKRPLFARYPATGRRNLLTQTEDLSSGVWTKVGTTTVTDIGGGAWRINNFSDASGSRLQQRNDAKPSTRYSLQMQFRGEGSDIGKDVGVLFTRGTSGSTASKSRVVTLTADWQLLEIEDLLLQSDNVDIDVRLTYSAGFAEAPLVRFPQIEEGTAPTAYQKVVTSADITEAGVRDVYASLFDGADDCLQVSGFDMSDTDKVTVIAGVRKLSDAAIGEVLGLATIASDGTFALLAPNSVSPNLGWSSKGTSTAAAVATGISSPATRHIVGIGDISGDIARIIVNQASTTSTSDQGTGNYRNDTLNIGGRNNAASLPFNGYIHYLFICGEVVPDSVLTKIYRGLGPRIGLTV